MSADFQALRGAVLELCGLEVHDLSSEARGPAHVLARQLLAHLGKQRCGLSYPQIARALGKASHSSMVLAARRFGARLAAREVLDEPPALRGLTCGQARDLALERARGAGV